MHHVVDLPGGWALQASDEAVPVFVHEDGTRREPKEMAFEGCAPEVYRALKLEEDRRVRLHRGVERTGEWVALWRARTVIGFYFNLKINPQESELDKFVHEETEKALNKEIAERAALWDGR